MSLEGQINILPFHFKDEETNPEDLQMTDTSSKESQ